MSAARGGDTIQLSPGEYSGLTIKNLSFDKPVVITSASLDRPAQLRDFTLRNVDGVTIRDVDVIVKQGDRDGLMVDASRNISVEDVDFHGVEQGRVGNGIKIKLSSDITIADSSFSHLVNGVGLDRSNGVTISDNRFEDLRIDGVHGSGTSNLLIERNYFTNFTPEKNDHPDGIQLFTTGTTAPAVNITIRDNVLVRGEGDRFQGIFVTDQSKGRLAYENVTITGNTVLGGAYHGITLSYAKDGLVSGNTVVGYSDEKSWIRFSGVTDGQITNNTTSSISLGDPNPGLIKAANTIVPIIPAAQAGKYLNPAIKGLDAASTGGMVEKALSAGVASGETAASVVVGDGEANALTGSRGVDIINGRGGADTMTGQAGDDTYFVDNTRDRVVEAVGGGHDTVRTTLSKYTLGSNVEDVVLTDDRAQTLTGNDLNNLIENNAIANTVSGGAGNDTIVSNGGVDVLTGGAGRDVFSFDELPTSAAKITDFVRGQDVLDLSGLLDDFQGKDPVREGWVKFAKDGAGNLDVHVDADGAGRDASFVAVVKIAGASALTANTDWLF